MGEASRHIATKLTSKTFKREEDVLEEVGNLCSGKDGHDGLDFVLESEGWTVSEHDGGHRLEKLSTEKSKEGRDLMGSFAHRDSMKQACILTVDEHQSELSEFLCTDEKEKKIGRRRYQ